jgi:hypothetical protein
MRHANLALLSLRVNARLLKYLDCLISRAPYKKKVVCSIDSTHPPWGGAHGGAGGSGRGVAHKKWPLFKEFLSVLKNYPPLYAAERHVNLALLSLVAIF